ncbi:MAG TPA: hypothetical protein ENH51_02360 [Euryarchaeota archaeon]|nr:hypothetical protein [Euryarchaeota archaeon]
MGEKNLECRLHVGEVCFRLVFTSPSQARFFNKYYQGFISNQEPDITIHVKVIGKGESTSLPNSIIMSKTVEGDSFNFHSGLITGTLDRESRTCKIEVKEALFKRIRIFEHFLFQTYYTLIAQNPAGEENFLAHSCSVQREGAGYLFSGPPESGKSTIAGISAPLATVLGDEIAIVKKEDSRYFVGATPFRGDFRESVNMQAPLKAVFLIVHGKENEIRKISKIEFVTRFVREVIYPGTLLSTERKEDFTRMIQFCTDISENVPFYELRFLPDQRFWSEIDNLNLKNMEE